MIEAVLFDLDETLILDEAVSEHAFRICAASLTRDPAQVSALSGAAARQAKDLWRALPASALEYAQRIGHSAFEGLWARYDPRIPEEASLEGLIGAYRTQTWQLALEQCGLQGDAAHLAALWMRVRAQYPAYPDADELLVRLRPNYKLGIVTNGVSGLQRLKLEGCGLLHWFDAVAVSGEVGIGKPEPGIFQWIAAQLGVPPQACLMVGDNPARDVQGGINTDMQTIWVRRFAPAGAMATLEVRELLEVLPWVESQL